MKASEKTSEVMEFPKARWTKRKQRPDVYPGMTFPMGILLALALFIILLGVQGYFFLTSGVSADGVVEVDVKILEGEWGWEPNRIVVPFGSKVILNIENQDTQSHGFAINELRVNKELPGKQTTKVEFVASQVGEFEFFCSVLCGAGHFDQTGTLIVTESGADLEVYEAESLGGDLPVRRSEDAIELLPYTMKDGVKEFELRAEHIIWDYGNGKIVESYGYNGQLPGPEIRVTEGDIVRVILTNNLPVSTTVHWHGVDVPNDQDGVPHLTQDPVEPGETFVYEFEAKPAGTRIYHTHGSEHGDEGLQIDMGLAGPFIIEPAGYIRPDVERTLVLTERVSQSLFPINGKTFPEVPSIMVNEGDRVRVRMINGGSSAIHPMHLHGHQTKIVAVDGNPVPEASQLTRNVVTVNPGESYDIEFIANNPGAWLFHCHELNHAEKGMIMDLRYNGFESEFL